jgi:RNA polymerase sigma-70 factor (ECF subfamily)
VKQHEKALLNVAYRVLGDSEQARDIVHDSYIAFWESQNEFKSGSSIKTYLYRIVINKCINYRRRRQRWFNLAPVFSGKSHVEPSNTYEIKEFTRKLFASIPSQFTAPLVLLEVDGMSYEEISDILELPVGTIRTRIFRCREKLRKELARMGGVL